MVHYWLPEKGTEFGGSSTIFRSRTTLNTPTVNTIALAIQRVSRGLLHDFNEIEYLRTSNQDLTKFMDEAVHRTRSILHYELTKARPTYVFCSDHQKDSGNQSSPRWILNPLSGKQNFLRGLPHFTISIALEINHQIIAGVVYDPIKDEMFAAEKGKGAYLNEKRIRVSSRRDLSECLIGYSSLILTRDLDLNDKPYNTSILTLRHKVWATREFGVADLDLAYVASGRLDGYVAKFRSFHDVAAGLVVLKEAGGFATNLTGQALTVSGDTILAGPAQLHQALKEFLNRSELMPSEGKKTV